MFCCTSNCSVNGKPRFILLKANIASEYLFSTVEVVHSDKEF